MTRITVFSLIIMASLLVSATIHAAGTLPPMVFMKAKVSEARKLLGKKVVAGTPEARKVDAELRSLIDPVLNFERMSENTLRSHWPTLKAEQRKDFISLFRALLFHSYLTRIRKADEAYTIEYESQEAKGPKAATVTAITRTSRAEIELVFHLIRVPEGIWVVEDIVIDEVSLIDNYREQFNRIIIKDGYGVLLQKMADRLVELGGAIPEGITLVKSPAKSNEAAKTKKPAPAPTPQQAKPVTPQQK